MEIFLILLSFPFLVSLVDFIGFLFNGIRVKNSIFKRLIEVEAFIILPYLYLTLDTTNNCCGDSAVFSPNHQLTILVIASICLVAYFYSSYRKIIATPILEILVNTFLITGIVLNIFIAIQTNDLFLTILGCLPIIVFAILALAKNQKDFINQSEELQFNPKNKIEVLAWKILKLKAVVKFPIIFILCLPAMVFVTTLLLLFGQKPDSIIRAFMETYKHGFSQWDYKCDNVQCGGHYLCSVAANGHKKIVKPQRLGVRNKNNIICNRQLLISNAFEDLLQTRFPFLHQQIRKQYNKVGHLVHRYYGIFNNKFIADFIYFLMKPLEWFFLLMLYTFDRRPENRIAKQYISNNHKQQINKLQLLNKMN